MPGYRAARLLITSCLTIILLLAGGCSGDDPVGPGGSGGPGTLPADPDGILLPGEDDANAVGSLRDMPPSAAPEDEIVEGLLTTRLMLWLSGEATVGQVNAVMQRHGARIVCMAAGHPLLTVKVPALADRAAAEDLTARIMDEEAIVAALPATAAYADPGVPDPEKAMPVDGDMPSHLMTLRAPAAWNALARARAQGQTVPILVPDEYHSDAWFPEIPALSFPAGAAGRTDPTENHGVHVAGIIGAKHDGTAAVGAHPDPALAPLTGILVRGLSWADVQDETIRRFPAAGNFVISSSLGRDWSAAAAVANGGSWTPQELFEDAILAISWRLRTSADWSRYVHATAAGNEQSHPGNMSDARIASSWTIARFHADPRDMFSEGDLPAGHVAALDHIVESYETNAPWAVSAQPNILVVGASDFDGEESAFSNLNSDIRTQGVGVLSSCAVTGSDGCNGEVLFENGTSMATPQVGAMAAWLWSLSPDLDSDGVIERLRHCYASAELEGLLDGYMLTLAADQSLNESPVRRAILDVAGTAPSPGTNLLFDEADLELYLTMFESHEAAGGESFREDFSRYDLNGDGVTGQRLGAYVDLNVDVLPLMSEVTFQAGGRSYTLDETAVTDREALFYYAYSGLYEGDEEARDELLAFMLGNLVVEVEGWETTMDGADENRFTVVVRKPGQGGMDPVAGANVTLTATGGDLSTDSGVTGPDGRFGAVATFAGGSSLISLTIDVVDGDATASLELECTRNGGGGGGGGVTVLSSRLMAVAHTTAGPEDECNERTFREIFDLEPLSVSANHQCVGPDWEDGTVTGNVSLNCNARIDADPTTMEFRGVTLTASGSSSISDPSPVYAGWNVQVAVRILVQDGPVSFQATGSMLPGDRTLRAFSLEGNGQTFYEILGEQGTTINLSESGILEPGGYWVLANFEGRSSLSEMTVSGNVEYQFTITPLAE